MYAAEFLALVKMPSLYLGALILLLGIRVTFISQSYLHYYVTEVKTLPVLTDLVLDNLPYLDISYIYDIFSLAGFFIFVAYIVHRRQFSRLPYMLLLIGTFHLVRGLFIVLTPFGNPPMFQGTDGPFNGFSNFELGVYPSGHVGVNHLYFLLATDRRYRVVLMTCVLVVIASLFLSRSHYSIDVLSGLFFAYAIKAFGDKYWLQWTMRGWGRQR
jgi:hypothetical protein